MLDSWECRQLAAIAERLRADDRVLARRLSRHRLRWHGLATRHRWVPVVAATLGCLAVSVLGLGLLAAGFGGSAGAPRLTLVATGVVVLALVPFAPVLLGRLGAWPTRRPPRSGRGVDHGAHDPTRRRP